MKMSWDALVMGNTRLSDTTFLWSSRRSRISSRRTRFANVRRLKGVFTRLIATFCTLDPSHISAANTVP